MGDFDSVLVKVGEFGRYQRRLYLLLCMACLFVGVSTVVVIMVVAEPAHRCAIPNYNDSYVVRNEGHQLLINTTIPTEWIKGTVQYQPCTIFASSAPYMYVNGHNHSTEYRTSVGEREEVVCDSWVYDDRSFESTAVSEMDLVCSHSSMRSHLKMAFMLGKVFGVIVHGILADLFGRKKLLVVSMMLLLLSGVSSAWVTGVIPLCMCLAILGSASAGVYSSIFVLGMEVTGPSKRFLAGTVLDFFFAIGECLVAAVGFLLRDRNWTVTVLMAPTAIILPFLWFVPESPRWMLQRGQTEGAATILQSLAKINKTELDTKALRKLTVDHGPKEKAAEICKSPAVVWRCLAVFFNWFSVSLVFYGLSLHSMDTVGNPYLNLFLFSLVEFPAYAIDMILLRCTGRKIVVCLSMCFGGLACISTIFPLLFGGPDTEPLVLGLSLIGKFGAAVAFTTLYTFTSELVPTTLRSRGIGASSTFARLGGVVAPYIAHLGGHMNGQMGTALPLIVFGVISVVAGLLNIILPETRGQPMPETIEDLKRRLRGAKEEVPPATQSFPLL